MNWQAVFFDFDGVVVDSVPIKTEAFAELFRPFGPDIEKKVVHYHLSHGGISRVEKFRYYYTHFLHRQIDTQKLKELSRRFSELVLKKVLRAPFVNGALETLKMLNSKSIPAYLVSGTPEDEIREIVQKRCLETYFAGVYGSPQEKELAVKGILQEKGYEPKRCLFVGDSMTDFLAAQKNELNFIGIVPKGAEAPFPQGIETSPSVSL